jgi:hypothetical protein
MAGNEGGTEGWLEYRRLVLAELERLDEALHVLDEKLDRRDKAQTEKMAQVGIDLLTLKIKASVYGAIAGAVLSAAVTLGATLLYKYPVEPQHFEHSVEPAAPPRH